MTDEGEEEKQRKGWSQGDNTAGAAVRETGGTEGKVLRDLEIGDNRRGADC